MTLTGLSVNQFNGIPETRAKMDGAPGACKARSVHHGSLLSNLKPPRAPEYISISSLLVKSDYLYVVTD